MLVAKSLSKSKLIILLVAVVGAVGASGFLIYNSYFKDKIDINITLPGSKTSELFGPDVFLPNVDKFDKNFFSNKDVQELKNVGNLPLKVESTGRVNPFAPLYTSGRTVQPGR